MIIRDSHFNNNSWGHGGEKRTAQIIELLADNCLEHVSLKDILTTSSHSYFQNLMQGFNFSRSFKTSIHCPWRTIEKLGGDYLQCMKAFISVANPGCFLWESTRSDTSFLPYIAKKAGIKTIALPHNLESLVCGQKSAWSGTDAPLWFREELEALSQCERVFTLSREEQWLLRVYGVEADFLPYYPPVAIHRFLGKIRENRLLLPQDCSVLMLGTASNPPTFFGMLDRIEFFKLNSNLESKLRIAGFNTESLNASLDGTDNIILDGAVDVNKLQDILSKTRAVVIHQQATSGAITKVPEMLMAGVPVIMNCDAARTWRGVEGVYTYDNDNEFKELIHTTFRMPPIPERPVKSEVCFVDTVRTMNSSTVLSC